MPIKHAFTSAKSDGADATLVRPSDWNAAHVIDGASFASIGARVWRSTNQSGPGTVSFDTEQWDTDGFWAVGNPTRLTVPAGLAGKYLIMGWFEGSNTGSLALRKNGSTNAVVAVNRTYACTIECVDNLVAGDYYELYCPDSVTFNSNTYSPFFTMMKLDAGQVGSGVGAKAYHNTTQGSLAASTVNPLSLNTEDFDTDGFHDTVTNNSRMTIPAGLSGKYLVVGKAKVDQTFGLYIRKNGSTLLRGGNHQSANNTTEVSVVADLAAGDYVEVCEYHDSGTATAGDASNDHLRVELSIMRLDSPSSGPLVAGRTLQTTGADYTTTSGTFGDVDATNLAITVTTGARRLLVGFVGSGTNSSSNSTCLDVAVDGTRQGGSLGLVLTNGGPNDLSFVYMTDVLTAGSHTIKLQWKVSGGTGTLYRAGGVGLPPVFWVQEMPDSGALASVSSAGWTQDVAESGTSFASFTAGTGTWSSNGTEIIQTDTGGWHRARYTSMLPLGYPTIMEAEMYIITSGGRAAFGTTPSNLSSGSGLAIELISTSNLIRTDQDAVTTIRDITATIATSTWYKLRVVLGNWHGSIYLDGTLVGNIPLGRNLGWATNAEYFMLASYGASVKFRNIKLWTLRSNAPI